MNKTILLSGVVFGVLAIILGAFGAHGLESSLDPAALESFETGVRYQMYHALLLMFLGSYGGLTETQKKPVYILLFSGVLLFSFSIYLLSTTALTGLNIKFLGVLTPFGGVLLILGWILLGYRIFKQLG